MNINSRKKIWKTENLIKRKKSKHNAYPDRQNIEKNIYRKIAYKSKEPRPQKNQTFILNSIG